MKRLCAFGLVMASGCLTGCQIFDPGGQTATAMRQQDHFLMTDSGVDLMADGTHTNTIMAARGPRVVATFDAEGNIIPDVEQSELNQLLWIKGNAEGAQDAFAVALQASVESQRAANELLGTVITSAFAALGPGARVATPDNDDTPAWAAELLVELGEIALRVEALEVEVEPTPATETESPSVGGAPSPSAPPTQPPDDEDEGTQ